MPTLRPSACRADALPLSYTSMVVPPGIAPGPSGLHADAPLLELRDLESRCRVPPPPPALTGGQTPAVAPANGADDGPRTRYPLLGRQALYQMSFIRMEQTTGNDPATFSLATRRSGQLSYVCEMDVRTGISPASAALQAAA